jgi:hypothetical protein
MVYDLELPMVVAVQLDFHGALLAQYDEMSETIGLLPGGPAVPQNFFHWVTGTNDGFRIVWESQEAFERFSLETLSPAYEQIWVLTPPELYFFDVYNYLAGERRWGSQ